MCSHGGRSSVPADLELRSGPAAPGLPASTRGQGIHVRVPGGSGRHFSGSLPPVRGRANPATAGRHGGSGTGGLWDSAYCSRGVATSLQRDIAHTVVANTAPRARVLYSAANHAVFDDFYLHRRKVELAKPNQEVDV